VISRELIVEMASSNPEAMDVLPRGRGVCFEGHRFYVTVENVGLKYQICGACGAVRISEPCV